MVIVVIIDRGLIPNFYLEEVSDAVMYPEASHKDLSGSLTRSPWQMRPAQLQMRIPRSQMLLFVLVAPVLSLQLNLSLVGLEI